MSFSGKIKEELAEHSTDARHCNLAELSAIVQMCGHFSEDFKGRITLQVDTENYPVARKCFTLMRKTFNIKTDIVIRRHARKGQLELSSLLEGRRTPCGKECGRSGSLL